MIVADTRQQRVIAAEDLTVCEVYVSIWHADANSLIILTEYVNRMMGLWFLTTPTAFRIPLLRESAQHKFEGRIWSRSKHEENKMRVTPRPNLRKWNVQVIWIYNHTIIIWKQTPLTTYIELELQSGSFAVSSYADLRQKPLVAPGVGIPP